MTKTEYVELACINPRCAKFIETPVPYSRLDIEDAGGFLACESCGHALVTMAGLKARVVELEQHADKTYIALEDSVTGMLHARITELERQLEQHTNLYADIPVIAHTDKLPQYDPVYVRTLWQAYNELQAHATELEKRMQGYKLSTAAQLGTIKVLEQAQAQQREPRKMADLLQGLGFVVVEPKEAKELREEGGNCPCCWHQVQP